VSQGFLENRHRGLGRGDGVERIVGEDRGGHRRVEDDVTKS
jgi:hypothetical protein